MVKASLELSENKGSSQVTLVPVRAWEKGGGEMHLST